MALHSTQFELCHWSGNLNVGKRMAHSFASQTCSDGISESVIPIGLDWLCLPSVDLPPLQVNPGLYSGDESQS